MVPSLAFLTCSPCGATANGSRSLSVAVPATKSISRQTSNCLKDLLTRNVLQLPVIQNAQTHLVVLRDAEHSNAIQTHSNGTIPDTRRGAVGNGFVCGTALVYPAHPSALSLHSPPAPTVGDGDLGGLLVSIAAGTGLGDISEALVHRRILVSAVSHQLLFRLHQT